MRKKSFLAASLAFAILGAPPVGAQSAPTVAVRAAAHDTFDRVVFDWPGNVKFRFQQNGEHAAITFDAAANLKFTSDVQTYLTRAKGFMAHADDGGHVTVSFTVNPGATVKTFTSASSVVVDISGKAAPVVPAPPPVAPPAPTAAETPTQPVKNDGVAATDKPQTLLPTTAKPAAPSVPLSVAPPKTAPVQPFPSSTVAPTVAAVVPVTPAATAPAEMAPIARANKPNTPSITLSDTPTLIATLDPRIPMRAAIYQRAEVGYVIFERKLTLSPAALENGVPALADLQAFDMPKNSGYLFPIQQGAELQATLDGNVWKIFLSRRHSTMPVTTGLVAQPDFALGSRYLLPLPDAPTPIHMVDPVVGDDLILVPLAQSEAFNVERHMSDLTILPAAQGLVIKPLTDKVIVRTVSDGIEITAEGGLQLSRTTDTGIGTPSSNKAKTSATEKSMFDFATWGGKPGETFTKTRQRLQQTIVDVPEAERNRARMELARFYFTSGNGDEALALLDYLAKQVPDLRAHSDFMALLGASEILAYRSDDGLRDLSDPALADQPEADLWQAVAMAQIRDWPHAEEKFAAREMVLTGYPEPFFSRFFVLAIESALAVGNDHEAATWLNYVTNAPHATSIDPALAFLRGVLEAKAGRATTAEEAWKEADASRDQLYKVRSELALIDLGVSTGSLTPAQATDRLEALRFAWRGDDLEVDILHRLGQFYIAAKNVKAGLNALAQAVTLYPASPMVPVIRAEMATTLHDIFLGDLGKKTSPLEALMLYQQYRDQLPAGKEGDAVMSNLSERLVAVDLLDQASSILEDLAKNHLQGEAKDRAVLRLAAIRLLDHKPTEALAAFDIMGNDVLSPSLQTERALLRARALSELHRSDEANALLKDNPSPDAKKLRADIAMHAQKWGEAAKTLMELVGSPPPAGSALSAEQAEWLVTAAIAYALADDQTNLDRLAIDYSGAIAKSPQNDTFLMLTRPEKTGQLHDLAAAQTQIMQTDMFQGFLNHYRNSGEDDTAATKKP
jgi:tetratricopeptide (TPR) repeat protein